MEPSTLLPEAIQTEAMTLAQQLGISLSDLYTDAIETYLRKHNRQTILEQLNQVYPEQSSALDPANVLLSSRKTGLPKDSVANVSQVLTIDKGFLTEKIGTVPSDLQDEIDEGLRMILYL